MATQHARDRLHWSRVDREAREHREAARARAAVGEQLAMAGCDGPSSSRFHGNHQDWSDRAQDLQARLGHRGTSALARARRHDDTGDSYYKGCGDRPHDGSYCGYGGDWDCENDISD